MPKLGEKNQEGKTIFLGKALLIFVAFLILILLSESLYILKNGSPALTRLFIEMAKVSSRKNDAQGAIRLLLLGANLTISQNKNKYPDVIPKDYKAKIELPKNVDLGKDVANYFASINYGSASSRNQYDLSRIFYEISILVYQNGNRDLFPKFLEISYYTDPTFGYWAVELANYYHFQGQRSNALEILERCQKVKDPAKQCKEFSEIIISGADPRTPGFLSEEVKNFFRKNIY